MKFIVSFLCFFTLGMMLPNIEPEINMRFLIYLDDEELKTNYDHQPVLHIVNHEQNKDDHVYLKEASGEMQFIDVPWSKKEDDLEMTWKFNQDMDDICIIIMRNEETIYQSEIFSVDSGFQEIKLYTRETQLTDNAYYFNKDTEIHMDFQRELDIEKTKIFINQEPVNVKWNEDKNKALLTLQKDGSYKISYELVDINGNTLKAESKTNLCIDHQFPHVEVYANQKQVQESFANMYDDEVEIMVHVDDDNFDQENSTIYINDKKSDVTWEKIDHQYQCIFTLTKGEYAISYTIKDKAKNETRKKFNSFTIDRDEPLIEIAPNSKISNTSILVHVEISDHNLSCEESFVIINDKERSDWKIKNDKAIMDILLSEEGDYNVYVIAKDYASHISTSEMKHYVIDKTPPKIEASINHERFTDMDTFVANQDIYLSVKLEDSHLQQSQISLYKNNRLILETDVLEHYEIQEEDQKNNDYRLVVEGEDTCGNILKKAYTFKIYTYMKPVKIINDIFKGKPSNKDWKPQLNYGDDVHVIHTELKRYQKEIPYTWGDTISAEGDYVLDVTLEDEAGNRSRLKPSFTFTIDKTAPNVSLIYKDLNHEINDKIKHGDIFYIMIEPYDEYQQQHAYFSYIRVNGKTYKNIHDKRFLVKADETAYDIVLEVYDDANNRRQYQYHIQSEASNDIVYKSVKRPIAETKNKQRYASSNTSSTIPYTVCTGVFIMIISGMYVYRKKSH